jgi:DNA invertase Pin-like site-specific DNA recombinase
MRVIGYMRVSGKGQVDEGGFPRQEQVIRQFCETHGLELAQLVREEGVSGTVEGPDRPELSKVLQADGVGAIVVEKLDRLSRELLVQELLIRDARRKDFAVFSAEFGRLEDVASKALTPSQTAMRQILGAMAEMDKSNAVSRMAQGRARVKAETGRCEGRKPFGEGSNLHEKKVLHSILEMFDAGIKRRFIVTGLAALGLVNPNTGKPYQKSFICKLLRRHRSTPL